MKSISIIVGASVAFFAALVWTQKPSLTKENVDRLIRKECPLGSTKDQVYEFLETRKIESGAYNAGPDPYPGLPDKEREWKRYVVAWFREDPDPSLSEFTIQIYFYFDLNYTMTEYKIVKLDNVP